MSNKTKTEQTSKPSKYPQGYFKSKPCKMCASDFKPNAPSEHYCSDVCKDRALKDAYYFRTYGISITNYEEMVLNQDGKCLICDTDGILRAASQKSTPLVVDHCHTTGAVRGLLCHTCNSALGQFNDSTEILSKAIRYLETAKPAITVDPSLRTVKKHVSDLSMTTVLNIITDRLDNSLTRKELMSKFKISEAKVKGIIELKTQQAKKAHKCYLKIKESATTIETQETEEVE